MFILLCKGPFPYMAEYAVRLFGAVIAVTQEPPAHAPVITFEQMGASGSAQTRTSKPADTRPAVDLR
ncbi:hypothetical protein XH90_19190 [Bradyrhizobium sp. CCBAU 53338]|nr:hypothetical protein XH90_19190 [Bradyrhizobium sp. CCBAU 53338]